MKKLFDMIKLRIHRKSMLITELVYALENIGTALSFKDVSAEDKIEFIQVTMFCTKINLKWMTGAMTRDEYENIYRTRTEDYTSQTEAIGDIIKSIQEVA